MGAGEVTGGLFLLLSCLIAAVEWRRGLTKTRTRMAHTDDHRRSKRAGR